jgi:NAD(P) transhydrogenase beta subunit
MHAPPQPSAISPAYRAPRRKRCAAGPVEAKGIGRRGGGLYGMPILDADRARWVIVIKRGMRPPFAGIENELDG